LKLDSVLPEYRKILAEKYELFKDNDKLIRNKKTTKEFKKLKE